MKKIFITIALIGCIILSACNNDKKAQEHAPADVEAATATINTSSNMPQVLKFSAVWCGPCKQFAPLFEQVAEEYKDKATFTTIDIDQQSAIADTYKVTAVPTIIFLNKSGKEVDRIVGAPDEASFKKAIDELCAL